MVAPIYASLKLSGFVLRGEIVLILTRRLSETICIGDDITVTVLGVKGRQVRVGISAPPEVNIAREELLEIQRVRREEFRRDSGNS